MSDTAKTVAITSDTGVKSVVPFEGLERIANRDFVPTRESLQEALQGTVPELSSGDLWALNDAITNGDVAKEDVLKIHPSQKDNFPLVAFNEENTLPKAFTSLKIFIAGCGFVAASVISRMWMEAIKIGGVGFAHKGESAFIVGLVGAVLGYVWINQIERDQLEEKEGNVIADSENRVARVLTYFYNRPAENKK
jgi:hypothetical protein